MTVVLIREPVQMDDMEVELDRLCGKEDRVKKDAKELLIYQLSDNELRLSQYRKGMRGRLLLKKAIQELGVEPYNTKSAEQYKAQANHELYANSMLVRVIHRIVIWSLCFVGGAVLLSLLLGIFGLYAKFIEPEIIHKAYPYATFGIVAYFFAFMFLTSIGMGWRSVPIKEYKSLPEFVLQTATKLKRRCPWASLYVHEPKIDPQGTAGHFLIVEDDVGSLYCLEFWK